VTHEDDYLAIRRLIEAYSDALNTRDFTTLEASFAENAVWQVDAPYHLRFEGAQIASNIAAMVSNFPFLMQMTHGVVVELAGDQATARTTVREVAQAADAGSGLNSFGIYYDSLVRTKVGWRFAGRRFQCMFFDTAPLPGTVVG
jgi:ketosteroid isomerase-like protein